MSRAALAAAVAVLAAAAVILLVVAGGESDEKVGPRFGRLVWASPPTVFKPRRLPRDRILTGRLRNDSLREIDLTAAEDLKLLDRAGRPVPHTAIFLRGFGRDIYPPRFGGRLPEADQLRLGLRARLKPGAVRPLTLSWRERRRSRRAVRIEFPGGTLAVPATSSRTAG